jgi:hypothetical protein
MVTAVSAPVLTAVVHLWQNSIRVSFVCIPSLFTMDDRFLPHARAIQLSEKFGSSVYGEYEGKGFLGCDGM